MQDEPAEPLARLRRAGRQQSGLGGGQVVSTGTCAGMTLARAGEIDIADFSLFGRVEA